MVPPTLQETQFIGWAGADVTPSESVVITGQFYARISEGERDPLTHTAMAVEFVGRQHANARGVMVNCDLICIFDSLFASVRQCVRHDLPEPDSGLALLYATRTGSEIRAHNTMGTSCSSTTLRKTLFPASVLVGPEGGHKLLQATVQTDSDLMNA